HLLDKKNVDMLTSHKVFTEKELESRCEIMLDNYCKTVVIEANTMSDMVRKQILPAVEKYLGEVSKTALTKQQVAPNASSVYEKETITKLSALTEQIFVACKDLETAVIRLAESKNTIEESYAIRDTVLGKMSALRAAVDEAETLTDETYWPFPSYCDLLFGVR
ncbi:MAG: glutamine synthetase type III, partial [Clostridia bacterium]|nr:glutamine synthetase type III [Clostridia bacterium]